MDSSHPNGDALAAPFIGFIIGTMYVTTRVSAFCFTDLRDVGFLASQSFRPTNTFCGTQRIQHTVNRRWIEHFLSTLIDYWFLTGNRYLVRFLLVLSTPQDKIPLTSDLTCSVLDLLHFVFSATLMYTFLISNFGVTGAYTKNVWFVDNYHPLLQMLKHFCLGVSR